MRLRIGVAAALGAQLWAAATPAQAHTIHRVPRSTAWTSLAAHGASTTILLLAASATAGAVLAAALARRGPGWRPPATAAAVAALVISVTARAVAGGDPVGFVHAAAAAVWIGCVVDVLAAWRGGGAGPARVAERAHRFGRVAIAAATVTVATGVWNVRRHVATVAALHTTAYGRILVAKLALVILVLGAGWVVQRRRTARWFTAEAAGLAAAVFAASLLLAVPVPFKGTTLRLGEVYRASSAGDAECTSRHLGHLLAVREINALHPGAVQLTTSPSARQLTYEQRARALLTACADAQPAASGSPVPTFGPPEVDALRTAWPVGAGARSVGEALGTFFAAHRIGAVEVIADGSARATALVDGLRAHGGDVTVRADAPVGTRPDAVVIAGDWAAASRALPSLLAGASAPVRGTYLAPWLLVPSLLQPALATTSAQVTVASSFDPQGAAAQHYLAALARFGHGAQPSGPGFQAYLEARVALVSVASGLSPAVTADRPLLGRVTSLEAATPADAPPGLAFYTPTRATILPPSLGHNHAEASAWVPGGQLAAISGLVPLTG
ncbi:MAG: CopD family protein [Actinobacteria bacterium]|nr:CopD family protein [Actinomycetota bacterium]